MPTRLLCPWNSPGKNTGVGCHALLQGIVRTRGSSPGLLHCGPIHHCLSPQGHAALAQKGPLLVQCPVVSSGDARPWFCPGPGKQHSRCWTLNHVHVWEPGLGSSVRSRAHPPGPGSPTSRGTLCPAEAVWLSSPLCTPAVLHGAREGEAMGSEGFQMVNASQEESAGCLILTGLIPSHGKSRVPWDGASDSSGFEPLTSIKLQLLFSKESPRTQHMRRKRKYHGLFTYFLSNAYNLGSSPEIKCGNNFLFKSGSAATSNTARVSQTSPTHYHHHWFFSGRCLWHGHSHQTKGRESLGEKQQAQRAAPSCYRCREWVPLGSSVDRLLLENLRRCVCPLGGSHGWAILSSAPSQAHVTVSAKSLSQHPESRSFDPSSLGKEEQGKKVLSCWG